MDREGRGRHRSDLAESYSTAGSRRLIRAVRQRALQLVEYPDMGRIVPEFGNRYIRELIEGDYRIVYERFADRVEVIGVIHGARSFHQGPPEE